MIQQSRVAAAIQGDWPHTPERLQYGSLAEGHQTRDAHRVSCERHKEEGMNMVVDIPGYL